MKVRWEKERGARVEVEEREREVGEVKKEHKGREKRSTSEVRRVRVRGGE